MKKGVIALLLLAFAGLGLAACGGDVSATTDTHVCVFDGSPRGGQRLKYQLPPGSNPKKLDDNDIAVSIPASNRFYAVVPDDNVRDPGAKTHYTGSASGGIPVRVEGQIRFKFNLEKACEWFSKHGRRNAQDGRDLGFNVRGDANQGWFRFLNEYFGDTMQSIVNEKVGRFAPLALHYNWATNADANGVVPDGVEPAFPTRKVLAEELGNSFSARLTELLAGDYFCGVNSAEGACDPMQFNVTYAGPGDDHTLVKDFQRVANTRQTLESARLEGELQAQQQDALIRAETAKAALLQKQAESAEAQARIDTAKCRQLAQYGLDCEGKRPPVIVSGQPQG